MFCVVFSSTSQSSSFNSKRFAIKLVLGLLHYNWQHISNYIFFGCDSKQSVQLLHTAVFTNFETDSIVMSKVF